MTGFELLYPTVVYFLNFCATVLQYFFHENVYFLFLLFYWKWMHEIKSCNYWKLKMSHSLLPDLMSTGVDEWKKKVRSFVFILFLKILPFFLKILHLLFWNFDYSFMLFLHVCSLESLWSIINWLTLGSLTCIYRTYQIFT